MPNVSANEIDARLAARIKDGDEEALRTVLQVHGGKVRGWLGKTYGTVLQDDALNEAFNTSVIKLWRNAGKFDGLRGTLGGWFLRIAQREAITILRREKSYGHRTVN
jgi:RNA polymerase sigma-70 factor, ECF subfamily